MNLGNGLSAIRLTLRLALCTTCIGRAASILNHIYRTFHRNSINKVGRLGRVSGRIVRFRFYKHDRDDALRVKIDLW